MLTLGQRIKSRRVLCWLSQEQFARRVGVSRRQIVYWEADNDAPSAERLMAICHVLQVSPDWLLTGRGWLSDINARKHSEAARKKYSDRNAEAMRRIRLYCGLPLDFENESAGWVDALPEDQGAVALTIRENVASLYAAGDMLLMKPLNIVAENGVIVGRDVEIAAQLHFKQAAVVLNGKGSLMRLHVEPAGGKALRPKLEPLEAVHTGSSRSSRAFRMINVEDQLLIQAAVYKCIKKV